MARRNEFISEIDKLIGGKVYSLRLAKGLSRQQLSKAIGVTHQQLQKYEKGLNRISAGRLVLIARSLGANVSYFYSEIEKENVTPEPTQHQRMCIEVYREMTINYKQITEEEIKEKIKQHELWLKSKGKDGECADFSGYDLSQKVLENANLTGADFSKTNMNLTCLSSAVLKNANLEDSHLPYTDLTGCDLTCESLIGAYFESAVLKNANCSYADFTGADFAINICFTDIDFTGANFSGACFEGVDMDSNIEFHNATFVDTDLSFANFNGDNILNADLERGLFHGYRLVEEGA